jgi:hypothetical protein
MPIPPKKEKELFIFLALNYRNPLHILDSCPLSGVCVCVCVCVCEVFFFPVLKTELRALCLLGRCSTT